jgi:hypothetical protein
MSTTKLITSIITITTLFLILGFSFFTYGSNLGEVKAKKVNCISEASIKLDLEKKLTLQELNNPIIQEMIDSEVISAKEQLKASNIEVCSEIKVN